MKEKFNLTGSGAIRIITGTKISENVTDIIPVEDVEIVENRIKLLPGMKYHPG